MILWKQICEQKGVITKYFLVVFVLTLKKKLILSRRYMRNRCRRVYQERERVWSYSLDVFPQSPKVLPDLWKTSTDFRVLWGIFSINTHKSFLLFRLFTSYHSDTLHSLQFIKKTPFLICCFTFNNLLYLFISSTKVHVMSYRLYY